MHPVQLQHPFLFRRNLPRLEDFVDLKQPLALVRFVQLLDPGKNILALGIVVISLLDRIKYTIRTTRVISYTGDVLPVAPIGGD